MNTSLTDDTDSRPDCKYGENCYQKNPQHHKRFKHPLTDEKQEETKDEEPELSPPKKKLKLAESESENIGSPEKVSESLDDKDGTDVPVADDGEILLPSSPETVEDSIKQKFLVNMPQDFYDFWDFCKSLCHEDPENALTDIGLNLVGVFEILGGKLKGVSERRLSQFLCHWRFYYDPPELQTVLIGEEKEYHVGYFRDHPTEDPVFLASMSSLKPGIVQPMKENLFATVYSYANSDLCSAKNDKKKSLISKLKSYAETKNYELTEMSSRLKERRKKVVSKSFHGAGIVVPVNKKTDVGYREIPETNADLKRILKRIVDAPNAAKKEQGFEVLQEILTNAQWATDEGDFGMGLELGMDLFIYGGEDFHKCIGHLLSVAYDLLDREPFAKILKAHLKNRRRGPNMSAFETKQQTSTNTE